MSNEKEKRQIEKMRITARAILHHNTDYVISGGSAKVKDEGAIGIYFTNPPKKRKYQNEK